MLKIICQCVLFDLYYILEISDKLRDIISLR